MVMSKSTFSLRKVATENEAKDLIKLLNQAGVNASLKKDSADLDEVLQGHGSTNKYEILIKEEDREIAESTLISDASKYLNGISDDHYLFEFSDSELIDILIKKDEWNELDVLLSEKILQDRKVEIDQVAINKKREQYTAELKSPEGGQQGWIIVGYISAILGGFLALIIGYFIWQAKNSLPNGEKVYAYNETVRKHGLIIFVISSIIFPVLFIIKIANEISFFSS